MLESFSACGSFVHTPWGPRKSGIPDSVEIPAPVRTTMRFASSTQPRTESIIRAIELQPLGRIALAFPAAPRFFPAAGRLAFDDFQRRARDTIPVSAGSLGFVEDGVGLFHQLVAARAASGESDADAGRGAQCFRFDVEFPAHRLDDLFGDRAGISFFAHVFEQDDELVPARARRSE